MSAHGDKYVLDEGKSGHARLGIISEIHDEQTRALLLGAGLEAGRRLIEFGCGLGYVTVGRPRRVRTRSESTSARIRSRRPGD